jgi:tRNA (guanine26-N2/guanine27-N2)-dimethyltransferase
MATAIAVPEGFSLHTENSAHILLPASQDAFLNPVQEFNRDLSVACIRVWGDEMNAAKEARWRAGEARSSKKSKSKHTKSEYGGTVVCASGA